MLSPFDLAASQPLFGGPSQKRWLPTSCSDAPLGASSIAFSSSEMNSIVSSSSTSASTNLGGILASSGNAVAPTVVTPNNDVVTLKFSHPTNAGSFDAFDEIDLEEGSRNQNNGDVSDATPTFFGINTLFIPPEVTGVRHLLDLSPSCGNLYSQRVSGLVAVTADTIRRLSWHSIQSFEETNSEMESLVARVREQEERKHKIYSALASFTILLFFCYLLATFSSDEIAEDPIPAEKSSIGAPKFLIPFHGSTQYSLVSIVSNGGT